MTISVFLSYSMPIFPRQQRFIDGLRADLKTRGLEPRTLGVTDYDADSPLVAIRRLLADTNGLLAVAFRRRLLAPIPDELTRTSMRPAYNVAAVNDWCTSPYCHIEAAMAFEHGVPVMSLIESGVVRDGVLQEGVFGSRAAAFDLEHPPKRFLGSTEWHQTFTKWDLRVRTVNDRKGHPTKYFD